MTLLHEYMIFQYNIWVILKHWFYLNMYWFYLNIGHWQSCRKFPFSLLNLSCLLKSFLHICETALLSNAITANLNDKKMGLSNTFHSITEAHFGNWTIKSRKAPTLLSEQLHSLSQQSIIAEQIKIKILLYRSPVSCSKKRPSFDANTAAASRHQMAQLNMFFFNTLCTSRQYFKGFKIFMKSIYISLFYIPEHITQLPCSKIEWVRYYLNI